MSNKGRGLIGRLAVIGIALLCFVIIVSSVLPLPVAIKGGDFFSMGTSYNLCAYNEGEEIIEMRTATSKTYFLGYTTGGQAKYALNASLLAIHYQDENGDWQDIDTSFEEDDSGNFTVKFTRLPYFGRIGEDSRRRIYPDRNNSDVWIEFQKPFQNMPELSRQNRWFYWDFTNALMGIRFDNTSVKFGFRLKNENAPTSITIPFTTQGITRDGKFLYHDGELIAELQKPIATDANGEERDCEISFGSGEVTVSLNTTDLTFPIDIDPTLDLDVGASSDDAFQYTSGAVSTTLTFQHLQSYNEWAGFRWTGVNIPSGATIGTSYISIYVIVYDDPDVNIYGQDANNPGTFTTTTDDISDRPRTTESFLWSTDGVGEGWKNTPSLTDIIQEIVDDNSGTGNALVIVWEATGNDQLGHLTWDSGDHSNAPKLHIEYTTGGACSPSYIISPGSWNVNGGSPVSESSSYSTGLTAFNVTNNSSGGAIDITISAGNMTGGGYTWVLSDTATPGDMIYGLKAGLSGESYNITVKQTAPYNTLVSSLADNSSQLFGLILYTPTNFDDGNSKSGGITLTVVCS